LHRTLDSRVRQAAIHSPRSTLAFLLSEYVTDVLPLLFAHLVNVTHASLESGVVLVRHVLAALSLPVHHVVPVDIHVVQDIPVPVFVREVRTIHRTTDVTTQLLDEIQPLVVTTATAATSLVTRKVTKVIARSSSSAATTNDLAQLVTARAKVSVRERTVRVTSARSAPSATFTSSRIVDPPIVTRVLSHRAVLTCARDRLTRFSETVGCRALELVAALCLLLIGDISCGSA